MPDAPRDARDVVLRSRRPARARRARPARHQFLLERRARPEALSSDRGARRVVRRPLAASRAPGLDPQIRLLDVEAGQASCSRPRAALALSIACASVVAWLIAVKTSRRVASTSLEGFDFNRRALIRLLLDGQARRRLIAASVGLGRRDTAGVELDALRLTPRRKRLQLAVDVDNARTECGDLLTVQLDLLLGAADVQLVSVRAFAGACRAAVGFGGLDSQRPERGFDLGDPGSGTGFTLARLGQALARRFNRLREPAILLGKEQLLPAPQLVAQLLVATRLRRPA